MLQTSLLVRELNRLTILYPAMKKEVNDYIQSSLYIILNSWKVPTKNITQVPAILISQVNCDYIDYNVTIPNLGKSMVDRYFLW